MVSRKSPKKTPAPSVRTGPSPDDARDIVYFKRHHCGLFCLLDYEARGQDKPLLVVVDGKDKPFRTTLSDSDYMAVRAMGEEYLRRNPRSIA